MKFLKPRLQWIILLNECMDLNQTCTSLMLCICSLFCSLGFNIVLYGLGSKRDLLEKFRTALLQDSVHLVVNGYFPSITVRSVSGRRAYGFM